MRKLSPTRVLRREISWTLIVVLSCAFTLSAQPATQRSAAEQKTAGYFESIRKSPPQELAFLLQMPKAGDLKITLSAGSKPRSTFAGPAAKGLGANTGRRPPPVPRRPPNEPPVKHPPRPA